MKKIFNWSKENQGTAAIEFAIVFPVFILFIFGIVNFAFLMWQNAAMVDSLNNTARYAYLNPTSTSSQLESYANTTYQTLTGNAPGATANVSFSATITANSTTTITGSISYTFLALSLPVFTQSVGITQPLS